MFSPLGLSAGADEELEARAGAFTAWLVKSVMWWCYCGAGISKTKAAVKNKRQWWDGATLQAYIFEALWLCKPGTHWSYGIPTPFAHHIQKFAFLHPLTVCMPLSVATMIIELFAPLVALMPCFYGSRFFAVCGLGLHYGIAYLQNIDFLSWWGPIYAFFLLDPAAALDADPQLFGILGSARASFAIAPVRSSLSLAVIAAWIGVSLLLQVVPKLELLPFSRFGMFDVILDLFNPAIKNKLWLTDKPHKWGTLNNYVFGPTYRAPNVMPEEYHLLPFRYLQVAYGGEDGDGIIHANFQVSDTLRKHVGKIIAEGSCGPGTWINDADAPRRLFAHLRAAQEAFDADITEEVKKSVDSDNSVQSGGGVPDSLMGA
jgi:hypothetical protein